MKKLLLAGVAAVALTAVATPAAAEIELELGGFAKGYFSYVDQDENAVGEIRPFDIIRHTEVHAGGETTLDNGLTVGVRLEAEADGNDAAGIEESYAYFSGGWGRVNVGAEDGANYLLQVAAPSGDSNVDGIRSFVQPVNMTSLLGAGTRAAVANVVTPTVASGRSGLADVDGAINFDYENNATGYADKVTYLSPVFGGFQVGVSYTADTATSGSDFLGNSADTGYGDAVEGAFRYEGQFSGVGTAFGAGYTTISDDSGVAANDDLDQWNVGLDLDFSGFGLGAVYTETNNGLTEAAGTIADEETLVVGVDYTTGAFKLGASYFDQSNSFSVDNLDTTRYTGGVVYTYGPGLTFRGSVSLTEIENGGPGGADVDGTAVLVGTQINF
jgi:predicted porin